MNAADAEIGIAGSETDGIQGSLQSSFQYVRKTPVKERYDADGAAGGDCDSRNDRHGAWRRRDDGKNVYQRTQNQADAEQALSLTAQLMTDEFANALEVKKFCWDFRKQEKW